MAPPPQVLQWLSFDSSTIPGTLLRQGRILLFYYWATYCILRAKKPRFQPLKPVEWDKEGEGPELGAQGAAVVAAAAVAAEAAGNGAVANGVVGGGKVVAA